MKSTERNHFITFLQDGEGIESEYDISSNLAEFDQARRASPVDKAQGANPVDHLSRPWQSADGSNTQTEECAAPAITLSLVSCATSCSTLNDEGYQTTNQAQGKPTCNILYRPALILL